MPLDTWKTSRSYTFRRVHGRAADALLARGWRRMGGHVGHDYDSHLMLWRTERDCAPSGEDSYGGE